MGVTAVKCHLCKEREPVYPSVPFPICGACKRSVWEREQHPIDERRATLAAELDALRAQVVTVRRAHAAIVGVASVPAFHPLQKTSFVTPPET